MYISHEKFALFNKVLLSLQQCSSLSEFAAAAMSGIRCAVPYENGSFFPVGPDIHHFDSLFHLDREDTPLGQYDGPCQDGELYGQAAGRASDYLVVRELARKVSRDGSPDVEKIFYLATIKLFHGRRMFANACGAPGRL